MSNALIVTLFKHIDSQDWNGLNDVFDTDIVYERPGYPPFVGLDRVMHFYLHERVIVSGHHKIERIVIDGDNAVCLGTIAAIKKDGTQVTERFADAYSFQNNRIRRRRSYFFTPCV